MRIWLIVHISPDEDPRSPCTKLPSTWSHLRALVGQERLCHPVATIFIAAFPSGTTLQNSVTGTSPGKQKVSSSESLSPKGSGSNTLKETEIESQVPNPITPGSYGVSSVQKHQTIASRGKPGFLQTLGCRIFVNQSTHTVVLFYMYFCLKIPYLIYITDSAILNSPTAAL